MAMMNFCISSDVMSRAGLNTALGIGVVFTMLVLISFIISLLKLVNRAGKKEETPAPVTRTNVAPVEEKTDDLELIAVISAAICAYEQAQGNEVSLDSLVVRSIRKVNKSKWQKA